MSTSIEIPEEKTSALANYHYLRRISDIGKIICFEKQDTRYYYNSAKRFSTLSLSRQSTTSAHHRFLCHACACALPPHYSQTKAHLSLTSSHLFRVIGETEHISCDLHTAELLDHLVLIYSRTFFIIRRILIAIRYIANGPIDTSTANLVMNLSEGDEKRVVLPKVTLKIPRMKRSRRIGPAVGRNPMLY